MVLLIGPPNLFPCGFYHRQAVLGLDRPLHFYFFLNFGFTAGIVLGSTRPQYILLLIFWMCFSPYFLVLSFLGHSTGLLFSHVRVIPGANFIVPLSLTWQFEPKYNYILGDDPSLFRRVCQSAHPSWR